jgi:hypothetical protein
MKMTSRRWLILSLSLPNFRIHISYCLFPRIHIHRNWKFSKHFKTLDPFPISFLFLIPINQETFRSFFYSLTYELIDFFNISFFLQIVTCTSKSPDGSVNVIQNGISLVEHASFQQNGVQGIWPLKVILFSCQFQTKQKVSHLFVL